MNRTNEWKGQMNGMYEKNESMNDRMNEWNR